MNAAGEKTVILLSKLIKMKMVRPVRHICLDLDGTLVDSFGTILNSTIKTLKQLNINNTVLEADLRIRIGHHFSDIFRDLKIDVTDIEHFISIYKTFYFEFINDSTLYPNVEETLSELKKKGILISLLTTKGQDQAEKIIKHFKLFKYFDYIMGRRPGIPVKPDPQPLLKICKELNIIPEESLMTGDTELDIVCGKNAGAITCGVTYGYREKENLLKENADFYINSLDEILNVIEVK